MTYALFAVYFAVLVALSSYGLHRLHLVLLCAWHKKKLDAAKVDPVVAEVDLPRVTVQLPLFNESTVAARLIQAVAKTDYPRELLEIQVLDDSTDETQAIVRAEVERLRAEGVDITLLHRVDRTGYKAGALDHGLAVAKGELIAIFDADFLPQPSFVRSIVGHFADPKVGMVQTRWGHMNRDASILTRVQALMLDGHHLVENRARFGAGHLFNFSGTGGMWRKEAIYSAGGWQHDTLTEDLDLSYRAQLAGWRFVYREDVVSPSELPEDIAALRAQQHRWAKGTVQTARKLLGRVLRDERLTVAQRIEAFFHMTPHFAYPLLVVLSVLLLPALVLMPATDTVSMILIDLPLCMASTGSLATFYSTAETAQGRPAWGAIKRLPMLIALGTGLAPFLSRAVRDGLRSMAGEFVRTPKKGSKAGRYKATTDAPLVEVLLALYSFGSFVASIETGHYFATPFAGLFCIGYAYVAVLVASEQSARERAASASGAAEAGVEAPVASGERAIAVPTQSGEWAPAESSVRSDVAA